MGSGSSRGGRAPRRPRGPDSRPGAPGDAAADGGTGPLVGAAAAAREEAPKAAAPPDGRDETLRLLDQLLAESAAWGAGERASRGPVRPPGAGSRVSPEQSAEGHPESSSVSEAPGSSQKRPEKQSAISYDYSEEELMASIEQEYCR